MGYGWWVSGSRCPVCLPWSLCFIITRVGQLTAWSGRGMARPVYIRESSAPRRSDRAFGPYVAGRKFNALYWCHFSRDRRARRNCWRLDDTSQSVQVWRGVVFYMPGPAVCGMVVRPAEDAASCGAACFVARRSVAGGRGLLFAGHRHLKFMTEPNRVAGRIAVRAPTPPAFAGAMA